MTTQGQSAVKLFLDEITDALTKGTSHDDLIGVVRRYKEGGLSQERAYDLLELIWLRRDCRNEEETSRVCDLLESVMERVWGYCPSVERLWEESLDSNRLAEFRGCSEVDELMARASRVGTSEALRDGTLAILQLRFPGQVPPDVVNRINSQASAEILGDWILLSARLPTLQEIAAYLRR